MEKATFDLLTPYPTELKFDKYSEDINSFELFDLNNLMLTLCILLRNKFDTDLKHSKFKIM